MTGAQMTRVATSLVVGMLCATRAASGQQTTTDPTRLASLHEKLEQVASVLDGLPRPSQKRLSSGAQNLLKLAHGWEEVESALDRPVDADIHGRAAVPAAITSSIEPAAATFLISNPNRDFLFSLMAGFTQSETSTAWCGSNVVTGFNDSSAFFESLLFGPGGGSFSGAAVSTNKGMSFRAVGMINPGASVDNFLSGDPVVTCAPAPTTGAAPLFFYTQLFEFGPVTAPLTGIALSKSVDGGGTWASPIATVQKDARTHFLDKPWSAVDPSNPNRLFITYTDFDESGTSGAPACGLTATGVPVIRTAIELVQSSDGGTTWSPPLVVAQACNAAPSFSHVQGSQVGVDSAGAVYVTWESFSGAAASTRALLISASTNHGATFGAPVTISTVVETGDGNGLQGGFRNNEFPMLAVDRASGVLYVAWNDGRNFAIRDTEGADGLYHFADILISHSTDGAATWSAPALVSFPQVPHVFAGNALGTDHYQPGIAVDHTGAVGVCWYDRRSDPANFKFGRACAISTNGALSWAQNFFVNGAWSPWHATDVLINPQYLGDYDAVASDFLQGNSGFLGAYGVVNSSATVPNQDVAVLSFP
jgi:hypothetical protein